MKQIRTCVFLCLATMLYSISKAQQFDSSKKWDIQNCFQYAAEYNIQITTLRLNELYAQQNLIASKGVQVPNLSASVGNSFNNANNDVSGSGTLRNQLTTSGTYLFNSSITLWNGNYINNNIRQNNLLIQSATLSLQQALNNNTLIITQAYLNILLAKENHTYIIDLVNTSTARVNQGQLFYDAGSIAKNNLLQLQAQLASDKYLLIQTQNAILQNLLLLKQILQLPSQTSFDIATPPSINLTAVLPMLTVVQQNARQTFPEIKIGKLGIDIALLDIEKAKAGFKPTLTAIASIGTGYSYIITNSSNNKTGYFTQSRNNFYQRLGLTLSIPIFSNKINETNLEKTKINYQQANLNLQNNQLVLDQAVEQAYLNASNAQQAYVAANEQLIAVTESNRIINEQFRLGASNSFDVLQQRNQYIQAVQAFTQAKYTAVLQQKIYQFYMGNPVVL